MPKRSRPLLLRNSTSSVTTERPLSIHPRRLPELQSAAIASQPLQTAILILTENQSPQAKKQNTHTSSMAIACQSESQPAEMHQLPAQLPSLPRSPSPHLARSFGCEIEIISSSWAPSLAWPAAVARRTRIILSSRSSGRLVAKLVMSLPYHCAVLTIANSISAATNAYGGNNSTSIRYRPRRVFGRRLIPARNHQPRFPHCLTHDRNRGTHRRVIEPYSTRMYWIR